MTLASVHSSSALPSPLLSPEAREDLNRYAEAGGFTLRAETSPWYAAFASVSRLDEARAASSVLAELRGHNVPDLQQAAERLADFPGLPTPTTVRETATAVSLLVRLRATLDVLRPEAYEAEADALDSLLAATATSAWRAERGVSQSWWQRTLLGRRARGLAASRGAGRGDLHVALAEAAATRTEWAALVGRGTRPSLPAEAAFLDTAAPAAEAALTGLGQLAALLRREAALEDLPFASLVDLLDGLASDEGTLYRLPRLRELHDALTAQGLSDLLAQLTEQQADVTATAAVVAQRTALDPDAEAALTTEPSEPEADLTADAEPTAAVAPEPAATPTAEDEPPAAPVAEVEVATDAAEPIAEAPLDVEVAPEAEAESFPDAEPENDVEPAAETDSAPTAEALPEPVAEVEVATDAAEPIAEAPLDVEVAPEAEAESVADTEPERDVEPAAETDSAPTAEALPEPVAEVEPLVSVATEAEAEVVAETLPAAPTEPQADAAEAAPEPGPVAEAPVDEAPVDEAPVDEALPEAEPAAEIEPEARPGAERAPRPDVTPGRPVTAYSAEQLEALVRWIDADGVERSDDELLRAAMKELGFSRLGPRIKDALGAAVASARG